MTCLDVCCGSRMFWFDKTDSRALFLDNRTVDTVMFNGSGLLSHPTCWPISAGFPSRMIRSRWSFSILRISGGQARLP